MVGPGEKSGLLVFALGAREAVTPLDGGEAIRARGEEAEARVSHSGERTYDKTKIFIIWP